MGININGRFLNHLRFADDIVLIAPNLEQFEMMLLQFATVECRVSKSWSENELVQDENNDKHRRTKLEIESLKLWKVTSTLVFV